MHSLLGILKCINLIDLLGSSSSKKGPTSIPIPNGASNAWVIIFVSFIIYLLKLLSIDPSTNQLSDWLIDTLITRRTDPLSDRMIVKLNNCFNEFLWFLNMQNVWLLPHACNTICYYLFKDTVLFIFQIPCRKQCFKKSAKIGKSII